MTWRDSVNQAGGPAAVANPVNYVAKAPANGLSAIDNYYGATEPLLTKMDPAFFAAYPAEITSLAYVGLISATENYFRDILGFILRNCPISRTKAAEEKVQLGSFLWGGAELHSRTAFDFIAFSASKNLVETIAKFTAHQIVTNGVWKKTLAEYDKLCEMRHGIVHSGRVLSGKNALKLGLPQTGQQMQVSPTYPTLQEAGAICTTLVQAANNELFETLVKRWAVDWRKLPSWNKNDATKQFRALYLGFLSSRDLHRGAISNRITYNAVIARVKKEYGV